MSHSILARRELCDRHAPLFAQLVAALGISIDGFIRTSEPGHHQAVQRIWRQLRPEDLSIRGYRGQYCIGCERFYDADELTDGVCPIHGVPPQVVEEVNHFFSLSGYQRQLESWLSGSRIEVIPSSRGREPLGFIRQGLRDSSVSRSHERSRGWGVTVPGDNSQTVYVWLDALTNYLSGLGFATRADAYERYWVQFPTHSRHRQGHPQVPRHSVASLARLSGAAAAHGDCRARVTVDGEKISKSKGNAVSPFPNIDRFGAEALRYYLLRAIPVGADGDFSEIRLGERYQADLVNGLGNLVRRLETLCERSGFRATITPVSAIATPVRKATERRAFHEALRLIWEEIAGLNQSIDRGRPWEALKDGRSKDLCSIFSSWVEGIGRVGAGLRPFLPATAEQIEQRCSQETIEVGEILFPRV